MVFDKERSEKFWLLFAGVIIGVFGGIIIAATSLQIPIAGEFSKQTFMEKEPIVLGTLIEGDSKVLSSRTTDGNTMQIIANKDGNYVVIYAKTILDTGEAYTKEIFRSSSPVSSQVKITKTGDNDITIKDLSNREVKLLPGKEIVEFDAIGLTEITGNSLWISCGKDCGASSCCFSCGIGGSINGCSFTVGYSDCGDRGPRFFANGNCAS